jgi:hypothetical protein
MKLTIAENVEYNALREDALSPTKSRGLVSSSTCRISPNLILQVLSRLFKFNLEDSQVHLLLADSFVESSLATQIHPAFTTSYPQCVCQRIPRSQTPRKL